MNRFDTAEILYVVAEHDLREVTNTLIDEWHDAIGRLPKSAAVEAVNIHHKTSSETITPAHVLDIAADIAQRKPSQRSTRRASRAAYTALGALTVHCPRCKAEPGEPCINPITEREAHAPCLVRLVGEGIPA